MTTSNHSRATRRASTLWWTHGLTLIVAIAVTWAITDRMDRQRADDSNLGSPDMAAHAASPGMDMDGMSMSSDGSVRLSAEDIRTFGVTFGAVEVRPIADEVRTVGIVAFDETRVSGVTPKFDGYVETLHVNFTGQSVRRGEPLAEIYSPELLAAQEELLLAVRLEAELAPTAVPGIPRGSSDLVRAARQRLRLWDVSEAQIDRVIEMGRARRTLTLYAPVSGIVVDKDVLPGVAVHAGQTLYTIADLSRVWIEAELREADAVLLEEGSAVAVELAAFPGRTLRGRIEFIEPTLDNAARTLKARIAIANTDGRLKPGMYATVRLSGTGRTALTVPASAVLQTGERTLVFVDMGGGRLMPHDVEIGRTAGGYAEVLAGLQPGQRIVTSAQYLLDSESNLAEVMKSMVGMGMSGKER